ncbi:MAG: U32 family peptidase [Firmicutes bacterium]|nr:U32 family peptidase [Bacillota bacterium]
MENIIELLSPAGDINALKAAINSGANAVYCGLNRFSARAKATNFSLDEMKNVIEYAHSFNAKVFAALNTLIYPNEMDDAVKSAKELHEANVDAVIVCDLGLVKRLREELPDLTLHASTQMGIHNLEGALSAKKLGIKRIILSRETTLADIKNIKANCDIELEFFAHGALCVSFSGNCYLSSLLSRQSGNRGRCLQLCRKEFARDNTKGFHLSTKDINMSSHIQTLIDAGITSFKIEGRLRKLDYVEKVTKLYRKILDGQSLQENDFKNILLRGGGTDVHLFNSSKNTICDIKKGHEWLKMQPSKIERTKISEAYIANKDNKTAGARNVQEVIETKCLGDYLTDTKCPERVEAIPCFNQSACLRDTKLVFGCQIDTAGVVSDRPHNIQHDNLYKTLIQVNSFSQLQYAPNNADCIIYAPNSFDDGIIKDFLERTKEKYNLPTYLNLPNVARGHDMTILENIISKNLVCGYVINNLYAFELTKGKNIILGNHLNIINNEFNYPNFQRILSLEAKRKFSDCDIIYAFGKPAVMTLCHCPHNQKCNYRCGKDFTLKDDKGASFVVKRTKIKNCYFNMHHNIPINAMPILKENKFFKNASLLFDFCALTEKELKEIDFKTLSDKSHKSTRGHLNRGAE